MDLVWDWVTNSGAAIGHGGSINGFAGLLDYYPDDDLVVAVLVNTESSNALHLRGTSHQSQV